MMIVLVGVGIGQHRQILEFVTMTQKLFAVMQLVSNFAGGRTEHVNVIENNLN